VESARFLMHYYQLYPRDGHDYTPDVDRIWLAQAVEAGLGIARAMELVPVARFYCERIKAGQATAKEIRACFRKLGILLEYLPNYADRREESLLLT